MSRPIYILIFILSVYILITVRTFPIILIFSDTTVVGDNINIIKTTFELNFDFLQAFKQHGYTKIYKKRKAVNLKSFTLITCKLIIQKNLNKKSSSLS